MKKVTELLPFALPPNLKIGHFQLFIKDVEVERLIAASNASGKPHCDFSFPPLPVVHEKMLVGDTPPNPSTLNKASNISFSYGAFLIAPAFYLSEWHNTK